MKRTKRECYIGEDGYCHVPLANGKGEAICDAEFINEVRKHSWSTDDKGYARTSIDNKRMNLHKFVFILKFGKIKDGFCLDHVDRHKLNNLISNLREATHQQNMINKDKITGSFKGVHFSKRAKKYVAQIRINNKNVCLGSFKEECKAAYFYDVWAFHYHKEFAVLNFPENIEKYKNEKPRYNITDRKSSSSSSSNFIGVYFHKRDGIFIADIKINGNSKYIGCHKDEISAAKIRDLYVIKNNLNLKLNFPKETYEQELNQELKQMTVFKAN